MYEEVFEEFQLTVVELPIEFVDDLPVYRGHLKELTFLSAEASSRKKLYQQLLQAYLLYREENQAVVEDEKDLALSICLEAAELLELFQWKTAEEGIKQEERIKEELADVLIYSYMMADNLGFDLDEIIEEKLKKNALKYPVPH